MLIRLQSGILEGISHAWNALMRWWATCENSSVNSTRSRVPSRCGEVVLTRMYICCMLWWLSAGRSSLQGIVLLFGSTTPRARQRGKHEYKMKCSCLIGRFSVTIGLERRRSSGEE